MHMKTIFLEFPYIYGINFKSCIKNTLSLTGMLSWLAQLSRPIKQKVDGLISNQDMCLGCT